VARWIGTATEIEDAKRSEAELSLTRREMAETLTLLETLYSKAPVGFGFVDRDFRVVRMNERLAEANGSTVSEQLGLRVSEIFPDLWPQLEPLYRRVLDGGQPVLDAELEGPSAVEPEEQQHWLSNFYPVRLDDEIIGVGVVVVDITERRRAELAQAKLTQAAVDAVAANRGA
jgi:PAS domain S-box-containing protein